jgi:hypothetical protein
LSRVLEDVRQIEQIVVAECRDRPLDLSKALSGTLALIDAPLVSYLSIPLRYPKRREHGSRE